MCPELHGEYPDSSIQSEILQRTYPLVNSARPACLLKPTKNDLKWNGRSRNGPLVKYLSNLLEEAFQVRVSFPRLHLENHLGPAQEQRKTKGQGRDGARDDTAGKGKIVMENTTTLLDEPKQTKTKTVYRQT